MIKLRNLICSTTQGSCTTRGTCTTQGSCNNTFLGIITLGVFSHDYTLKAKYQFSLSLEHLFGSHFE